MTPNIGPRGRRRRMTFGIVSLGAALLLGIVKSLIAAVLVTLLAVSLCAGHRSTFGAYIME